jgi:nicotinamide-nucleotide amidase
MKHLALIATGDELLNGTTQETNCHEIAKMCTQQGIQISLRLLTPDHIKHQHDTLTLASHHADAVILTGGLGPTDDDVSRQALASFLKEDLITFNQAERNLRTYLSKRNQPWLNSHRNQCLFPKTAELIPNLCGSSTGCMVVNNNHHYWLLPGPPRECMSMFTESVLPVLIEKGFNTPLKKKIWVLKGIPESQVQTLVHQTNQETQQEAPIHFRLLLQQKALEVSLAMSGKESDSTWLAWQKSFYQKVHDFLIT